MMLRICSSVSVPRSSFTPLAVRGPRRQVHLRAQQHNDSDNQAKPVETQAAPQSQPAVQSGGNGAAVAAGAAAAAVLAFVVGRLVAPGPSLALLEEQAVPLEQALANGKPTVMEFYASWCEVCRELVPEEYAVEQEYRDKVNFVMLNIENTKWGPEVTDYRVGGIPHFVFLDKEGQPLAAAVGRLPRQVLEGNVQALAEDKPLPFTGVRGKTSSMSPPAGVASPRMANPRDHA